MDIFGAKQPSFEDMKQRTRILVIDDKRFPYQSRFQNDGYSIDKWNYAKSLTPLETNYYDIILLDQHGIGKGDITDGMTLIKHIKKINPAQIIIAYSQSKFSLSDVSFFNAADGCLDKNEDYCVFKGKVDSLIIKRFSPEYYAEVIKIILQTKGESFTESEVRGICKYLKKHKFRSAEQCLSKMKLSLDVAKICLSVISIAKTVLTGA
jgi:hypothetical protein